MSAVSHITARREERHALVSAMDRLLTVAEQRGGLSPLEQRRFDADEARVRALDREMTEMESALPAGQRPNPMLRELLTTERRGADGGGTLPGGEHRLGEWLAGELRALSTASNSAGALVPSEWMPMVWDLCSHGRTADHRSRT